jgi:orotate phosphoribosyltransferase
VRKRGMGANRVEGIVLKDMKVLLVDDMMAAGASKAGFVSALRARGARVQDLFIVFDYGILGADSLLDSLDLRLHALANWRDVFAAAEARNDFGRDARVELAQFLEDPSAWSSAHGGIGRA